ncbi:MAG: hypothetical protein DWQ36_05065 [Acidobacteria bacterium]|nr:MAG: hypothetical protein DWQ30_10455 [Acidobacteriota bacterium]REK10155.1 MAG: hypothetical protein DWQ36_05065 [Acidobacteriota bacterium]
MIDLHSHILPDVDDGPGDFETALRMCLAAREDGCHTIVATPHHRHPLFAEPRPDHLRRLLARLQSAVGPGLRLLVGAEIRVDDQLVAELVEGPADHVPVLGESRSLLLEFPDHPPSHDPAAVVHELAVAGYRPVVAHPELLPWLAVDLDLLRRLVHRGALLQITADSVTGRGRSPARSAAREMIESGLAHIVASDCHDLEARPPGLTAAWDSISRRWGVDTARRLLLENPRAVLRDQPLERAA